MAKRKRRMPWQAWALLTLSVVAGVRWLWTYHRGAFVTGLVVAAVLAVVVPIAVMVAGIRAREKTWLYHYYLPDGRLRYIGITYDREWNSRHRRHREESWWWSSSTGIPYRVKCYPSWKAAHAVEVAEIEAAALRGEPIANERHVPRHVRQARIRAYVPSGSHGPYAGPDRATVAPPRTQAIGSQVRRSPATRSAPALRARHAELRALPSAPDRSGS